MNKEAQGFAGYYPNQSMVIIRRDIEANKVTFALMDSKTKDVSGIKSRDYVVAVGKNCVMAKVGDEVVIPHKLSTAQYIKIEGYKDKSLDSVAAKWGKIGAANIKDGGVDTASDYFFIYESDIAIFKRNK